LDVGGTTHFVGEGGGCLVTFGALATCATGVGGVDGAAVGPAIGHGVGQGRRGEVDVTGEGGGDGCGNGGVQVWRERGGTGLGDGVGAVVTGGSGGEQEKAVFIGAAEVAFEVGESEIGIGCGTPCFAGAVEETGVEKYFITGPNNLFFWEGLFGCDSEATAVGELFEEGLEWGWADAKGIPCG
jgi:hypothetical protein